MFKTILGFLSTWMNTSWGLIFYYNLLTLKLEGMHILIVGNFANALKQSA